MYRKSIIAICLSASLASGCSTAPRSYAPELASAPADQAAYQQALSQCQMQVAEAGGRRGRTNVATGVGSAAVGGMAASGASWGASAAAAGAGLVALPIVPLIWLISRSERGRNEDNLKHATGACLEANGYVVSGWTRVRGSDDEPQARPDPVAVEVEALDAVAGDVAAL